MTKELQALLQRLMDAADEDDGKIPVAQGAPVLVGEASMIQNAQDLAREVHLRAQTGWFVEVDPSNNVTRAGWDPREKVADSVIWRADQDNTVVQDDDGVSHWLSWWPDASPKVAVATAHNPPYTTRPRVESDVFGRGARELPCMAAEQSFFMRKPSRMSRDLRMGFEYGEVPRQHTIVFWVWPDTAYLQTAEQPMTICCVWGEEPKQCYWLGITTDGRFVYRVSPDGYETSSVSVTSTVALDLQTPEPPGWYRVAARYDGAQIGIGVSAVNAGFAWDYEDYSQMVYGVGWGFYVGGSARQAGCQKFRGRVSCGYYYCVALTDPELELLAGQGVAEPVAYDAIMSSPSMTGALRDHLVSCWQLDEPSGAYAYDKLGRNNLHWGFWWQGSAPGPGTLGFPAIRFTRTVNEQGVPVELQYLTCNDLASALSDSSDPEDPHNPHCPMTLIALLKPHSHGIPLQQDGIVGLGVGSSSLPYRMWELNHAFHRDSRGGDHYASATVYTAKVQPIEESSQTAYGGADESGHVLCTVWGPSDGYGYAVTLYVDDPTVPYDPPKDLTGDVTAISFDRFSVGAIARSDGNVIFPLNASVGILIVVPRAVSDEERVLLMQWVKATAGLIQASPDA